MNHFYENIDGWFDYQDLFAEMVSRSTEQAKFVEIGVYKGRSTSFLAVEILNSQKNIQLAVVDSFAFCPKEEFLGNLSTGGVDFKPIEEQSQFSVIPNYSCYGHRHFENQSLDFVFIDAAHDYNSVRGDIAVWLPKVKPGGYIGGHDYEHELFPDVKKAVHEVFETVELWGKLKGSWLVQVPY